MSKNETLAVYAAAAEKKAADLRLQLGSSIFNPAEARKVRAEAERQEAYAANCRKTSQEEVVRIWFDSWGNACNADYTYVSAAILKEFRRKLNVQPHETDWAAASRVGILETMSNDARICWALVSLPVA